MNTYMKQSSNSESSYFESVFFLKIDNYIAVEIPVITMSGKKDFTLFWYQKVSMGNKKSPGLEQT